MKGYLGPYRNTRYQLPEFQGGRPPIGYEEIFYNAPSEMVYGMCNSMCTKGFLNYFSAEIEFLKVVLRVKL